MGSSLLMDLALWSIINASLIDAVHTLSPDESKFMDVQILSRVLEAKLTVCWCSLGENIESSEGDKSLQLAADVGMLKKNVIFSSKICDNVELEVGNRVRIYSPWKEVQVDEDERIILCMYFSQIMS
ncbi:uncharacterized protein LOC120254156 isoform X2 [Dioscorea cayenensis subsp. rotundata]|uniref:Uncharacterized protein LOC120254156 isoform X2 n=1 Tax=Dioscorea cayennensis subsp. rotundata TaxID=55577 RepID=A0AB40AT03_DIOCR|nr:uncharacterized protein LOC120254156 isoform X2 [Dioscorea cayenensis subsp. rotundata]